MGSAGVRKTRRSENYLLLDHQRRPDPVLERISQDRGIRSFEKSDQGNEEAREVF